MFLLWPEETRLTHGYIHFLHKVLNPDCAQSKNIAEKFDEYLHCKGNDVYVICTL